MYERSTPAHLEATLDDILRAEPDLLVIEVKFDLFIRALKEERGIGVDYRSQPSQGKASRNANL